jgi:fructokinase
MLTDDQLPKLDQAIGTLHVGSISIVPEPSGSTLETLCNREHQARVISFDPNIRAGLIKDRAKHLARLERLMGIADLVKLSDEDLAWIDPHLDAAAAAQRWLDLGAKVVTVTSGAKGAVSFCKRGQVEVAAQKGKVADTVGAGDTFTAGILTYLHRNSLLSKNAISALDLEQLQEALRFAARAAAITVSRPGADPPWSHEMAA